jgi:alpha-1,2-mannosyltransferase
VISNGTLRCILPSDYLVRLWGDVLRAITAGVVVFVCTLWIAFYWANVKHVLLDMHMNDFGKFYYSARLFLEGGNMYGPNAATLIRMSETIERQFWNMNPPHFHLPLLPLAMLEPITALAVWACASLVAFALSLIVIVRTLDIRITPSGALWALLGFFSSAATGTIVITGQLTFLLLLPLTLAWAGAREGRWTKAGVHLGLCISIKPFLVPLLGYLMFRRQWRAVLVALATIAAAFAAGLAVFKWQPHMEWLRVLSVVDWAWVGMNGSLLGFLERNLTPTLHFTPFAELPSYVRPLWLAGILVIGLVTMAAALLDRSRDRTDRGLLLVLLASQLVSPLGWIYYMWLPLAPMVALATAWRREGHTEAVQTIVRWRNTLVLAAIPFLMMPLIFVFLSQPSALATITFGSGYFWGTFLLWLGAVADWRCVSHQSLDHPVSSDR